MAFTQGEYLNAWPENLARELGMRAWYGGLFSFLRQADGILNFPQFSDFLKNWQKFACLKGMVKGDFGFLSVDGVGYSQKVNLGG